MGEWRYSSIILDLSTRWRRVVSLTPLQLYPPGKEPPVPVDKVCPRAGLDAVEKRKMPYLCRDSKPAVQPVAIPTELTRLLYGFREKGM
jgi:hypothetical protein